MTYIDPSFDRNENSFEAYVADALKAESDALTMHDEIVEATASEIAGAAAVDAYDDLFDQLENAVEEVDRDEIRARIATITEDLWEGAMEKARERSTRLTSDERKAHGESALADYDALFA